MDSNTGIPLKAKIIRSGIMFLMITSSLMSLYMVLGDTITKEDKWIFVSGFQCGMVLGLGVFFSYKFHRDYYVDSAYDKTPQSE